MAPSRSAVEGKERYQRLRALGICTRCTKADAVPGKARCAACLAVDRGRYQARLAARAQGGCMACGRRTAAPGRRECARCLARNRRRSRKVRARRRAEVLCLVCGGEIEFKREGKAKCGACSAREVERATGARRRLRAVKALCRALTAVVGARAHGA